MQSSSRIQYEHNYRIVIEYDGGAFHGWQKQNDLRTIQGELERAMHTSLRSNEISGLQAAGRTDAGVHARAQVVNFKTNLVIDPLRFKHSISSILKGDVAVLDFAEVSSSFNALHSAKARQYCYRILNRPSPAVLDKGRVWHITADLDLEKMKHAASVLIGEHDFTSFRGSGCMSSTPIKKIFESEITRDGDYVLYRVKGKGFLKQMVRNIVGTLVQHGRGTLEAPSMEAVLEAKNRQVAGVTAPAHGLYLDYVQYPDWESRQR